MARTDEEDLKKDKEHATSIIIAWVLVAILTVGIFYGLSKTKGVYRGESYYR